MAKTLSEAAKDILKGQQPLVEDSTANSGTLKPGSKHKDPMQKLTVGKDELPADQKVQDLGPAIVTVDNQNDPARKAAAAVSKDSSKSSKSPVAGDKAPQKLSEEELDQVRAAIAESLAEDGVSEEEIKETIESLSEEELNQLAEESLSEEEAVEAGDVQEEEEIEEEIEPITVDMSEHLDALFNGETLSEEFKAKAKTIFETAVITKIQEEMAKLEEVFAQALEEETEKVKTELAEGTEDYINYVVEQWVSDNEVAIEAGLRTELTEDFISGLRTLFAEHYIDIPEDKVSVVEELTTKTADLEDKLNEEIEKNVELNKLVNEFAKAEIVAEITEGLTDTQVEKIKELAEGVEFIGVDEFQTAIKTLKENYFPTKEPVKSDIEKTDEKSGQVISEEKELTGPMANYVKTLGRTLPN
jgi:hypothetical protein